MAKKPVAPGKRKKRILRDALILLACLAVLFVAWDFPIFTQWQALAATQRQNFFGPGEVIGEVDYVGVRGSNTVWGGKYDRYYILRDGDWYAWCGVNHYGLFWQTGGLEAVKNDPSLPLVPLVICDWADGAVLAVCNDPEIAEVEVLFPYYSHASGDNRLHSTRADQRMEDCYIIYFSVEGYPSISGGIVVRGYDAAGVMVYQSPVPEDWETGYGLTLSGQV